MTMKCNVQPGATSGGQYSWYRDEQLIEGEMGQLYTIYSADWEHSGTYRCRFGSGSFPITLYVNTEDLFSVPEINNGHDPVIEGDDMTLTCSTRLHPLRQDTQLLYAFYRDGQKVQEFKTSNEYRVWSTGLEDYGRYKCEVRKSFSTVRKTSAELLINIQDLFSVPKINDKHKSVMEGDNVTLTCTTRLHPLRQDTQLRYAFYRDVQEVQGFGASNTYRVLSARLKGSGKYKCDVRKSFSTVIKTSAELLINIRCENEAEPVSDVNITVSEEREDFIIGENLTLTCIVQKGTSLIFRWLHNDKIVNKDSESFQLQDNASVLYIPSLQSQHAGTYKCNVSNALPSSAVGTIQIPQIMESRQSGLSPTLAIVGVSLLIVLLAGILMFIYRDKIASHFKKRPQTPPNLVSCPMIDNICYATINIKKIEGSSVSPKHDDEHAVLYAVITNSGTTSDSQATPETHDDTADVYQNIKAH
ncbi:Fc receptor-like protein 6 [Hyperolius riggenbachi]|uniref:Fc receptor-like protein 6 n=1 Tax=Hyperolius riggenbachi TaxID=752182 RepID=UPI0035A39346